MTRSRGGKTPPEHAQSAIRLAYGRERTLLHHRGKTPAAIDDLVLLDEFGDRRDAEEAAGLLADANAKGEKPIPWATARKKLGL